MDMIVKDNDINKQSFRTRQLFTDFVSARECKRLILYGAMHIWGKQHDCRCSLIFGKIPNSKEYIKTYLSMIELKVLFTSIMMDSSNYAEESLLQIKEAVLKTVNENSRDGSSESVEVLFERPFEIHAQTEYERDYGWEYYRDELIKQGNQWGDTRSFFILGVIIEDFRRSRFIIDESEPRSGTFEAISVTKKDGGIKKQRIYNIDFDLKNRKNKEIGDLGELLVIDYEKNSLRRIGKSDLADKVVSTSKTIGNAAPYDILSYTKDGKEKYIEVKTTEKDFTEEFYISANERKFAKANAGRYYLYRIFRLNKFAQTYKLLIINDLFAVGIFSVHQYSVTLNT